MVTTEQRLNEFHLIFPLDTFATFEMWTLLSEWLRESDLLEDEYSVVGKPTPRDKIDGLLSRRHPDHVGIVGNELEIHYGTPRRYKHDLMTLEWLRPHTVEYDSLIRAFSEAMSLVMAWEFDQEYNFWQNAHDPIQYESRGRSFDGLPMVPRGSIAPFDKELIIDTSQNVGRRVLGDGYVEAVGGIMYFGASFWERTGAQRAEIERLPFVLSSSEVGATVKIAFHSDTFQSAEGSEGEVQSTLRSALYPNAQQGGGEQAATCADST